MVNNALVLRRIESKNEGRKMPLTMDHLNLAMKKVNPTGGYRKSEVVALRKYATDNCYPRANTKGEDLANPSPLLNSLGVQQGGTESAEPAKKPARSARPSPKTVATSIL